jgi:hypothetical protein
VEKAKLGQQLGEVKRIGEWVHLQEGDTKTFDPGSKYYAVQGKKDEIVVEAWTDKVVGAPTYLLLQKTKPIEQVNKHALNGAKNDEQDVQASLQNIRQTVPFLKEMHADGMKLTFIALANDTRNFYVKMMYTRDRTGSHALFVRQYANSYAKGAAGR